MNIAVTYENGQVCDHLGKCREFLIVSAENGVPTGKRLVPCAGDGHTAMLKLVHGQKVDVLICGTLGIAARNSLEMIGVLLVPGCTGAAEEAVAKFLIGEQQGDPSILDLAREDDPDDPLACMHDCAKCAGCGPIEVLKDLDLPKV